MCTDGDAILGANNEVISFCYNGSWYTVNSADTIVNEQQSGTSQNNGSVAVLGTLLAVAIIVLIGITTALSVYIFRTKYKNEKHVTPSRQ